MSVAVRGACLTLLLGLAVAAAAGEFRSFEPIPTPLPEQAAPRAFVPVDPRAIRTAVEGMMEAWNTPDLRDWLSVEYYDKTRLLDGIDIKVPRDASIRVLAIESAQTMDQNVVREGEDGVAVRVSRVAVLARTAVEYNDPVRGFQRREGVNEYLFEVREVLR